MSYIMLHNLPPCSVQSSCVGSRETTPSDFGRRLMWAWGRVDVLCVDGLRLLRTVWELLFSTKQALQCSGKSPNAEPRCLMAAGREGGLCHTVQCIHEWSRATFFTYFWWVLNIETRVICRRQKPRGMLNLSFVHTASLLASQEQ